MNVFRQLIGSLGAGRVLMMGGIAVGVIAFFIFLTSRLTAPDMGLLYADLAMEDSSRMVAKLESMNVPYQIRGNGNQIMVPRDQVLRLRMTMAQEGLPQGGSVGYEIFDQTNALGQTSFVQNLNYVRALEGELSRTIRSLGRISAARVHLVLPRRELFGRDTREPSASIILRTSGQLERGQIAAIQHLVAAAVPKLATSRVSIVDDKGNLLARGGDGEGAGGANTGLTEYQSAIENRMKRAVEELIERTVGAGKVRATVAAEIDFDRVTTNDEVYDPDSQVVRSTQTIEEQSQSTDSDGNTPVTVGTNLPEAQAPQDGGVKSSSNNRRTEETVNFEISKTNRTKVHETGVIRRLSVAVLVDGVYTRGADGAQTYTPRGEEELQRYVALVRSTVGFNQQRGDTVEVVNMPFSAPEAIEEPPPPFLGLAKADYLKIGEFFVFIIIALLVLLFVVRPIISRSFKVAQASEEAVASAEGVQEVEAQQRAQLEAQRKAEEEEMLVNMAQVEGRVKASTVKKIGDIVDKHPDEALSIIRSWLYQEA